MTFEDQDQCDTTGTLLCDVQLIGGDNVFALSALPKVSPQIKDGDKCRLDLAAIAERRLARSEIIDSDLLSLATTPSAIDHACGTRNMRAKIVLYMALATYKHQDIRILDIFAIGTDTVGTVIAINNPKINDEQYVIVYLSDSNDNQVGHYKFSAADPFEAAEYLRDMLAGSLMESRDDALEYLALLCQLRGEIHDILIERDAARNRDDDKPSSRIKPPLLEEVMDHAHEVMA